MTHTIQQGINLLLLFSICRARLCKGSRSTSHLPLKPTRKLHCLQQDGVTAANVPEFQTILLWNTFVFAQIWLGLICLPVCTVLLITPLQTISVVCATVGTFASIAATVMCLLQLGNQCYAGSCKFGRDCGHFL